MADVEFSRRDILKLHKDWLEANAGLDMPSMASAFPSGSAHTSEQRGLGGFPDGQPLGGGEQLVALPLRQAQMQGELPAS